MSLRPLAVAAPLLCLIPGISGAQQISLATAVGPLYDDVANCLVKEMEPRALAAPVVRPPPTNRAEVHLYLRGSERFGTPIASFFVSQLDNGTTTIAFEERTDHRGQHAAAAKAAAQRCLR